MARAPLEQVDPPPVVSRTARPAGPLPEGAFAVVMATGIVSLASRGALPVVSGALLCVGLAALIAIGGLLARRRGGTHAWWDTVTLVAGLVALAGGLRAHAFAALAMGLEVAALALWLWVMFQPAPWVSAARQHRPDEASGRRLLILVATQSAVIAAAAVVRTERATALEGVVIAVWAMAIALYPPIAVPVIRAGAGRTRRGAFRADDWIAMGALAIATLAAAALLHMPAVPLRPEIRALGLVTWTAACFSGALLARLDLTSALDARRWLPDAGRWSMVFPLGMFSAASEAFGRTASFPVIATFGRAAMWVAVAVWGLVAAGCLIRAAGSAARSRASDRPPGGEGACDVGQREDADHPSALVDDDATTNRPTGEQVNRV